MPRTTEQLGLRASLVAAMLAAALILPGAASASPATFRVGAAVSVPGAGASA